MTAHIDAGSTAEPRQQAFLLNAMRVDPAANEIMVGGVRRRVRRKLMDALLYLATRPGAVVTRTELLEGLWVGRIASDESLTQLMSELRRTIASAAQLETVSGRGYRLAATIKPVEDLAHALSAQMQSDRERAASDRRWGFALLLGFLISAQALMFAFGGLHHH